MSTPYLNPRNDIAFKRLFGTERNKQMALQMLNSILHEHLTQSPNEQITH